MTYSTIDNFFAVTSDVVMDGEEYLVSAEISVAEGQSLAYEFRLPVNTAKGLELGVPEMKELLLECIIKDIRDALVKQMDAQWH